MKKSNRAPRNTDYFLPPTRDRIILAIAFLFFHIPFLNQAFIIDDGNFVDQALNIIKNPLAPYSFSIHLREVFNFFDYFANPPGWAYYLAAMIKLFGRSEIALHSASLVFSALALLAMYALSREITGKGLYGALFLLFTPTFLLSSHTVMADVPAMAFYVLAIFFFVRGMDKGDLLLFALAGIAAGISSLLKYSGGTVLPLMLLYWFLYRKQKITPLISFIMAGLIFGAWCFASYSIYGQVHFISMVAFESAQRPLFMKFLQGVAGVIGIGGATIFPLFLILWSVLSSFGLSRIAGWSTTTGAVIGFLAALPAYSFPPIISYDPVNRLLGAFLLSAGLSSLIFVICCGVISLKDYMGAIRSNHKRARIAAARSLVLVCWFLGIFVFNMQLLFSTPKYLVPGLPALILLLLGATGRTSHVFLSFPFWQKTVLLATTAALSVSLSLVDASYGNSHKKFITETLSSNFPKRQVWFNGHWTIRYYSEKMGYRYLGTELTGHSKPEKGDIIFVVEEAIRHSFPPGLIPKLKKVDRKYAFSPLPLLLTSGTVHAGYWVHGLGVLPYVLTDMPMSTINIYQFE